MGRLEEESEVSIVGGGGEGEGGGGGAGEEYDEWFVANIGGGAIKETFD